MTPDVASEDTTATPEEVTTPEEGMETPEMPAESTSTEETPAA